MDRPAGVSDAAAVDAVAGVVAAAATDAVVAPMSADEKGEEKNGSIKPLTPLLLVLPRE